ncbi:Piezo-type mechanosensitive ion channel component [Trichinella pseudospiralis]
MYIIVHCRSPPNFPPYNCYKQQCTINKYDYGEKNPTNCELPRRNAIKNSYDYENTENDKYWMDEANAIHTNTEECFSQLANGSTNTKLNPKRPFQEGTNYLYQNYYHEQNNIAAPANKSLYNDTTEQFNYEGKNFLSIDGTDNQERYLKPGGNYSIHQFDEKDCFFESINQNECPAKANRQVSSLVDKESEEKDLLALAMEILYETVPRETKCEEKENFPTMDNANNIKCSEKDWGNNIIQQSVETNCPFESFHEQPSGSLHLNEEFQTEYSPNFDRIYDNSMTKKFHQIPPNMTTQQHLHSQHPQQLFHDTFAKQYNLQNTNAPCSTTDHAYNTNYGYYQQNLQQGAFNQQFIPQPEGNPYYENNLQAVYANKTVDPLSNYWQPQISSPQGTFSQQFIPQPEGNPYYENNLQAVYANKTVDPLPNYWQHQISAPQGTFSQQFIPQQERNPYYENNLQAVYGNKTVDPLSNYWQHQISSPQGTFNQQFIPQPEGNPYYVNNLQAVYANETVDPLSNYWQPQIGERY